ncbi:LADA_0G14730g1_1 [Lachancea dasiensis]|uniref:LADA_0G14730g1_1 n=1 Tax=Lachancea dasiensis TaxID=1072105 RepID=A0A1G4JWI7_9SACH|nr:LADA_0G14730g1_1 [Lachancea dasiensis]
MITDQYVLEAFEAIDKALELTLQQSSLAQQHTNSNTTQLKSLQDRLWLVRNEVSQLSADLRHGKSPRGADLKLLEQVLRELHASEAISQDFVSISNDVEFSVRSAISQYIAVCLYYSAVHTSLDQLPLVSDTARYYDGVLGGTRWSILYALQVLPSRMVSFGESIKGDMRVPRSTAEITTLQGNLRAAISHWYQKMLKQADKLVMIHNFELVGLPTDAKKWARSLCALPLAAVRNEVRAKRQIADSHFDDVARRLGALMTNFPKAQNLEAQVSSLNAFLGKESREKSPSGFERDLLALIPQVQALKPADHFQKPTFWTRYWIPFVCTLAYGPSSAISIWQSRYRILQFCQENIVDFCSGLLHNWVWVPLQQVWSTVRHDEKNSTIAIASKGSLESEFGSLTRMVVQLVAENSSEPIDTASLAAQVETGDLTEFMQIYEHQIHHPIKNIVSGKLVRSLLIQLQKTKVDGSLALSGIDQLLQSQQLVFGVVAMSPALLIIYCVWVCAYRFAKLGRIWSNTAQFKYRISSSLNNIERLLNYNQANVSSTDKDLNTGLLALEVVSARHYGDKLVPKNRRAEWTRDIGELVDANLSYAARLNVVNRIYHVYARYLR